jgi:ribosomal protein S18 acetylase RimI-like enzyme
MVSLEPMDSSDFEAYIANLVQHYAASHVRTGRWTAEEGPQKARAEVDGLLPSGLGTPNHYLFRILAGEPPARVGVIWLAIEPHGGFIYDLEIFEPHRRRGFAEEAMRLIEGVAREKGADTLSLHVFGDNASARRLYGKLGYAETNVRMSKSLSPGSA